MLERGAPRRPEISIIERDVSIKERERERKWQIFYVDQVSVCARVPPCVPRTHFVGIFVEYLNICDTALVHEVRVNIGEHA